MKIKKIAQVIGLSSALTLTAPMQTSHATAAVSGVATPVAVFMWTFGSFFTSAVGGALGVMFGACTASSLDADHDTKSGVACAFGIPGAILGLIGGIALYCSAFDAENEEIELELPYLDATSCQKLDIEKKEIRKYNHQVAVFNCHIENLMEAASKAHTKQDRTMADQAIAKFKDSIVQSNIDIDFIKGIFAKIAPDQVNPILQAAQHITH